MRGELDREHPSYTYRYVVKIVAIEATKQEQKKEQEERLQKSPKKLHTGPQSHTWRSVFSSTCAHTHTRVEHI